MKLNMLSPTHPSFVIILNVILISLIFLIILRSNLSLHSTISASFFSSFVPVLEETATPLPKSQRPRDASQEVCSHLGILLLQKLLLPPKHSKRRGSERGRSHAFLSQLKSSPYFSTSFCEKLSVHKNFTE